MDDQPIAPGKVPAALLEALLRRFGAGDAVRLGPAIGEDACAIDVGDEVLVVAADPITLTGGDVGRYAVFVNANDVAVMGAQPRWFLATCLFPTGTSATDVEATFAGLDAALAEVGAVLVGGHSEVTAAVRAPVVSGTMLGIAPHGRVVTTGGARAGDVVVQIGATPVEGAAVLAAGAPGDLAAMPPATLAAARNALDEPGINVVVAALEATALGATSLHDPTEGGLASGLHEVARASGLALHVDTTRVRWFAPGVGVCEALGADPWATLASGCVLATFPRDRATSAVERLTAGGHVAAVLGDARRGTSGVFDETGAALSWPERDEVARVLAQP
jgi:hydrogenase expression/formation protein HypE